MLSFECIKNEKSVYFLLTSAKILIFGQLKKQDNLYVQMFFI